MEKGVKMALVGDQGEGQYLRPKALHNVAKDKKYEFMKYINWFATKEKPTKTTALLSSIIIYNNS